MVLPCANLSSFSFLQVSCIFLYSSSNVSLHTPATPLQHLWNLSLYHLNVVSCIFAGYKHCRNATRNIFNFVPVKSLHAKPGSYVALYLETAEIIVIKCYLLIQHIFTSSNTYVKHPKRNNYTTSSSISWYTTGWGSLSKTCFILDMNKWLQLTITFHGQTTYRKEATECVSRTHRCNGRLWN